MESVTSTWPTSQVAVAPTEMAELKDFEELKAVSQQQLLYASVYVLVRGDRVQEEKRPTAFVPCRQPFPQWSSFAEGARIWIPVSD